MLEARAGEGLGARIDEQFGNAHVASNRKPCSQAGGNSFPESKDALLPAFSHYADINIACTKRSITDSQSDQFRYPKTEEGQRMLHVAGRTWINENDHELARVHLEVIDPISIGLGILAKLQKGATIEYERRQFNDEIWLPVRIEITFNLRLLLVKGLNMRQIIEYSDHKKYSVDTILKFTEH